MQFNAPTQTPSEPKRYAKKLAKAACKNPVPNDRFLSQDCGWGIDVLCHLEGDRVPRLQACQHIEFGSARHFIPERLQDFPIAPARPRGLHPERATAVLGDSRKAWELWVMGFFCFCLKSI